jgi:hypothetical protein
VKKVKGDEKEKYYPPSPPFTFLPLFPTSVP